MSGVISTRQNEAFITAGWAYRLIMNSLLDHVEREDDRRAVEAATAIQGLMLEVHPHDQAVRLARALEKMLPHLRRDLDAKDDRRDQHLAQRLIELQTLVARFLQEQSTHRDSAHE